MMLEDYLANRGSSPWASIALAKSAELGAQNATGYAGAAVPSTWQRPVPVQTSPAAAVVQNAGVGSSLQELLARRRMASMPASPRIKLAQAPYTAENFARDYGSSPTEQEQTAFNNGTLNVNPGLARPIPGYAQNLNPIRSRAYTY